MKPKFVQYKTPRVSPKFGERYPVLGHIQFDDHQIYVVLNTTKDMWSVYCGIRFSEIPIIFCTPIAWSWMERKNVVEPILFHEVGHLEYEDFRSTDRQSIEEEIRADKYSAEICGKEKALEALRATFQIAPKHTAELLKRIAALKGYTCRPLCQRLISYFALIDS